MRLNYVWLFATVLTLSACNKDRDFECEEYFNEDASTFAEVGSINIGGKGAAEISAYDPQTKKLFVVTNFGTTRIDVLDLTNPALPVIIGQISIAPYGGGVNSVAVHDGKVAAAVEGFAKTDNGKVVIFRTTDYSVVKEIPVGALPDMITYSMDGEVLMTANEGEPSDDYLIDPVGSVSIISVKHNYRVSTIDFSSFNSQKNDLIARGLRVYGLNADLAKDIEPEYVAISLDGKTAWVTLQENNAIAKLDINSKRFTAIFPLGYKNYNTPGNEVDLSDKDGGYNPATWNVKGMYQPDAIAVFEKYGRPYLFTANEGDAREYTAFTEMKRVKDVSLDPTVFPDATLKTEPKLGRLNITTYPGDLDADGDRDVLNSLGARSFSVWNGWNGKLIFDSKNELEKKCVDALLYDDGRSDDKGVEPEGMTLGLVGKKAIAFVGMERADAMAIYDITNPEAPKFIKLLKTGDAPEGITFIHASKSPVGKSLVVVTSENDGVVKIYQVN